MQIHPHSPFKDRLQVKQLGCAEGIKQVHSWLKTKSNLLIAFMCQISWEDTEEDDFCLNNNHPTGEESFKQISSGC